MESPPVAALDCRALLEWFEAAKRDLPWRKTKDPYAIWVSEIMAQQTQIGTVIPYWLAWMERFPTVRELAAAEEQEILSMWQGLGYYRRARMLLQGAKFVAAQGFPLTAKEWEKVPGVGPYTASAIASISSGEVVALVDGNVERVFARLTGCELSDGDLHQAAWAWAKSSIPASSPGDWNEALMELGATVCTPKNPDCSGCPWRSSCSANRTGRTEELPKPKTRKDSVALEWNAVFGLANEKVSLRQSAEGEWWTGMWVPAIKESPPTEGYRGKVKTVVTHHKITLHVYTSELAPEGTSWIPIGDLTELPIPAPFRRALDLILFSSKASLFD